MDFPSSPPRSAQPVSRQDALEAIYATGHWLLEDGRVADAARVFRAMVHASPRDERGWLGLGECHERQGQLRIAAELYGAGGTVAEPPVRCRIARARALAQSGLHEASEEALDSARQAAEALGDDGLLELVAAEPRRLQ